jgi:hypothetical protein
MNNPVLAFTVTPIRTAGIFTLTFGMDKVYWSSASNTVDAPTNLAAFRANVSNSWAFVLDCGNAGKKHNSDVWCFISPTVIDTNSNSGRP